MSSYDTRSEGLMNTCVSKTSDECFSTVAVALNSVTERASYCCEGC